MFSFPWIMQIMNVYDEYNGKIGNCSIYNEPIAELNGAINLSPNKFLQMHE